MNRIDQKQQWALGYCKDKGLRRTRALETLIFLLAGNARPVSWPKLTTDERLKKTCDPATVFRMLQRLEKIGLVRKLGLHSRSMHYYLNFPGEHHHYEYLVCSDCGAITELDIHCPVGKLQDEIARQSGFKNLYHELEFYGICPKCQH